jgi:peroxiredoxin Q/BCP
MTVGIGGLAPEGSFEVTGGARRSISDYRGTPVVVYFYPKDDTTGCTREAQDFSELSDQFATAGVKIVGISKDSIARHDKFVAKYNLQVELGSDSDGSLCEAFGVWVEKTLYGRKYMGIERATFLIASDGKLVEIWRKVKVAGHAALVLKAASTLN